MSENEYEFECLVKIRISFKWNSDRWSTPRKQAEAIIENHVFDEVEILECTAVKTPTQYDETITEHYGE